MDPDFDLEINFMDPEPILESVPDPGIPFFSHILSNALKKTILVHILLILSFTNNFTTILRTKQPFQQFSKFWRL